MLDGGLMLVIVHRKTKTILMLFLNCILRNPTVEAFNLKCNITIYSSILIHVYRLQHRQEKYFVLYTYVRHQLTEASLKM